MLTDQTSGGVDHRVGGERGWREMISLVLTPLLVCCIGASLVGCASTKSNDVTFAAGSRRLPRPTRLFIVVGQSGLTSPADQRLALQEGQQIAASLKQDLMARMQSPSGGVRISDADEGPPGGPDTLIVRCVITRIKAGNQALRLGIGFGAGRALLQISTELVDPRGRAPLDLATFDTRSSTGAMPGAALGLASAASAGGAVGISGGSAGLLLSARDTMSREVSQSSAQIAGRVQSYFQSQGWLG